MLMAGGGGGYKTLVFENDLFSPSQLLALHLTNSKGVPETYSALGLHRSTGSDRNLPQGYNTYSFMIIGIGYSYA